MKLLAVRDNLHHASIAYDIDLSCTATTGNARSSSTGAVVGVHLTLNR
ncbi:hypothetical protein [Pararobbsia alpina]|uniref:Uncharacterized protein n=1 Tax=Pararobbsia alpina TaxID=621374 RepID=A0A6S7D0K3_9BURK|nr:hypothetical protein [Pararobbsia alpina]CAB3802764.1 hypothetical protein LMG28138_05250 [Pararobbsia alpina]